MGCTLNCTPNDFEQLIRSIRGKDNIGDYLTKDQFEKVRETLDHAASYKLSSILSNPNHRAHQALSNIIAKSFKSQMTDREKTALPKALNIIIKDHPHAMGLFVKAPVYRGPGASRMQHHYELLSTAALKVGSFKSQAGKVLSISPADGVDFGIKLPQNYGQPKRFGTIEADTLIYKFDPFSGGRTLGIDAKHSKTGNYGVPEKDKFQRQLNGIRTGLRDGKIQEFYFVTNGEFGTRFKEMVAAENVEIAKDYAKTHNLLYHREKYKIDPKSLTILEQKYHPPGKIALNFFNENNDQVKGFIDRYHIPQIDLCEYVKFPGT